MGVARDGSHKRDYQPGMELHGKYTLFAAGARGHLTKELKGIFNLEVNSAPQVYGIGLKRMWTLDTGKHVPGREAREGGVWVTSGGEGVVVGCGYSIRKKNKQKNKKKT